jgi:hypothetical protein
MEYDSIGRFRPKVAVVVKDGKYGAVDEIGNLLIPLVYNEIAEFSFDTAPAKKDSLWGYIKIDQSVIIPFIYDDVKRKSNGYMAEVKKGDFWGVINLRDEGEILTPFEYDNFESINYGYKKAMVGELAGVIKRGRPFLQANYTDIRLVTDRKLVRTLEKEVKKPQNLDPNKHNLAPEPEMKIYIHALIKDTLEIYSDRGELVASFEKVGPFKKGIAIASSDGVKVYINKVGTILGTVD